MGKAATAGAAGASGGDAAQASAGAPLQVGRPPGSGAAAAGAGQAEAGRQGGAERPVPQRLLAEATRLFAERGFEGTSVQEIVEAAGVTKGALYHYFGSKDDLLHEIYGRLLRLQQERLDGVADSGGSATQRLRAAAADVIVTTLENLDDAMIFFRSMHQLTAEKQQQVRAERRRYHERFRALIEEGQRTGEFAADLAPDLVVDYHFGAVHHLSSWYRPHGEFSAQQVADQLAELLMRSLRP